MLLYAGILNFIIHILCLVRKSDVFYNKMNSVYWVKFERFLRFTIYHIKNGGA